MSEQVSPDVSSDLEDFAQQIADQVESFLLAIQAIARGEATGGHAISLLLLEVSQVLLAGARLGVQTDFETPSKYEPDAGPDPDLDDMRLRLAVLLEGVDAYTEVFDPYEPRKAPVPARISDDLADVMADLRHGMSHYRAGRTSEDVARSLDDGSFAPPWLVPELSTPFVERGPTLSRDGLELILASNRPGTLGQLDLWGSSRTSLNEPWAEPQNLGPTVNAAFNDAGPRLSFDGTTLYFQSAVRPENVGGPFFDVWATTRSRVRGRP